MARYTSQPKNVARYTCYSHRVLLAVFTKTNKESIAHRTRKEQCWPSSRREHCSWDMQRLVLTVFANKVSLATLAEKVVFAKLGKNECSLRSRRRREDSNPRFARKKRHSSLRSRKQSSLRSQCTLTILIVL
jgi:hypothetical protein